MLTKQECLNALDELILNWGYEGLEEDLEPIYQLINEHFDNPQIDWLKNCIGEEAFNLIFSSQEEVNKWVDRMRWHVKKCDEYGRELDILKNNPPLKFDELKEENIYWDNHCREWVFIKKKEGARTIYLTCFAETGLFKEGFEENRFYRKEVQE